MTPVVFARMVRDRLDRAGVPGSVAHPALSPVRYVTWHGQGALRVSAFPYASLSASADVLAAYEKAVARLPGVVETSVIRGQAGPWALRDQVQITHLRMYDDEEAGDGQREVRTGN
jgi:hypothetical protein